MTYLIRATARSVGAKGYSQGEKHIALVFVLAETNDAAKRMAVEHLEATGWVDVELEEQGLVDAELLDGRPYLISTYERCLADGSAGIIFSDPLA